MAKKVVRMSATGEETVFDSLSKAAVETAAVSKSTLIRYLKAGLGSALGGYTWKFVAEPSLEPAVEPAAEPAAEPIAEPAVEPTVEPAVEPVVEPEPIEPLAETVVPATEPIEEPMHEPAVTDADIEHARSFFEALRTDDGRLITEMRVSDGYVNATKMCQSAGKEWGNYYHKKGTREFIGALETFSRIHENVLVQTTRDGPLHSRGTWVHPDVAIDLARHCSPAFHVKVIEIVRRYASGQITTSESRAVAGIVREQVDHEYEARKRKLELDEKEWEFQKKQKNEELGKKREELAIKREELDIARRKSEDETEELRTNPKAIATFYKETFDSLGIVPDGKDKILFRDAIHNAMHVPNEGGPGNKRSLMPISDIYRSVTGRAGTRAEWTAIGKLAAKAYREKNNGQSPPQAERFIDGASRWVNCYTQEDADNWLTAIVRGAVHDAGPSNTIDRFFGR